jgi:hypothetical protein
LPNIFELLGLDEEEFAWQKAALCKDMETEFFYEKYETDPFVAEAVDQTCLSCPVMNQCLSRGVDNQEWGVWGGVYLTAGKTDKNRNAHKSEEVWTEIKNALY